MTSELMIQLSITVTQGVNFDTDQSNGLSTISLSLDVSVHID
jgi:hypothetical protein